MSDPRPRDAAPTRKPNAKATRTPRFWAVPIVVTLAVLSALAAVYLGGTLKPTTNLRHLPIAVVNEDTGPVGQQIVNGLVSGLDKTKFEVRVLPRQEAVHQLDIARIYGAVGIPPTFSAKLQAYAKSTVTPGRINRPVMVVLTNPRAGALGSSIAGQSLTRAAAAVNSKVGARLSEEVAVQTGAAPMAGAVTVLLANPIDVVSKPYEPLPDGTGNGLSAFYYALLLLLAGFTASVVVNPLVDSTLGNPAVELGRVSRFTERVRASGFRTLLIKWALMVAVAVLTSAVYLAIAKPLGMPIAHGLGLWLYGAFAIAAVGITSLSLITALGTPGLLISMFVFVILGLPSAGATIPLEATPSLFGSVARFDPMHQVFLGTRALLYLDARADAGLAQALTLTSVFVVIGLLIGGIAALGYGRRAQHRVPAAPETATTTEAPDAPEAVATAEPVTPGKTTNADE
jgi:uncharacterized phage infection (PIP) family protein YhgE